MRTLLFLSTQFFSSAAGRNEELWALTKVPKGADQDIEGPQEKAENASDSAKCGKDQGRNKIPKC
jgi:hypothetical protein